MTELAAATLIATRERPRALRIVCAVGCVAALVPLCWLDVEQRQLGLYFSWLAAMALYLLQWPRPRGVLQWRPSRWLQLALVLYALGLFLAFCAVYGNWRWGVTGDSLYFYGIGEELARGNPAINWLSLRGVFEQCTVVQATLQNVFMHFSSSLFAHRLGNLVTSTLVIVFAALFAAETSGATAAVQLALFLAVHSVFILFTLVSYPNLSGILPYYAAYATFVAAWRVWRSDFLWAALGLICGLAIYFMPLWMGAVGVVSAGVVLSALYWRAPRVAVVWIGGALVAALPALVQFGSLIRIWFAFQSTEKRTLAYFLYIAGQTLTLPFASDLHGYGAEGPWLRPPFGYLFLAGTTLAALSGVLTLLRRPRGRVLQSAWAWLLLYLVDVVGLALENSGYATISLKRAIVLLPGMTLLMVLPLAWLAEQARRAWITVAITLAALVPFAYLNLTTLWFAEAGFNVADGLLRMTQEGPGAVLLVTPSVDLKNDFGKAPDPGGQGDTPVLLQRLYHVRDRVTVSEDIPRARGDFDRIVCFSAHTDGPDWATQVREALLRLCPNRPVEGITAQLECVICDPP